MRGRHPAALPEAGGERIRGALGGLGAARVSGPSADLRPAALGEGAGRVHRLLQPSPAAPGPRSASALSASRHDSQTGWPGGASRSPRWPAPRITRERRERGDSRGCDGTRIAAAGSQGHRFAAHLPRRSPRALCAEADCGRGRLARVLAEKLTLDEDANDLRAEPGVQQRPLLFDQNLVTLALAHSESVSTRDGEPEWTCLANHLSAVNVDLRNAPELVPVEIDTMPLGLSHLEVEVKATDE